MKKTNWNAIILIGAVSIGGYLLYNWWKGSSVGQAIGGIGSGIATTASAIDQGMQGLVTPVVPETPGSGVVAPTPLEYGLPILGIPKFLSNFAMDNTGKVNPLVAPIKAALTVQHDLTKAGILSTPKSSVSTTIAQMEKSYKTIPKAKINTLATPNRAALITNVLTSKTVTMNKVAPSIQIQQYGMAPRVVKVGGVTKKVM